MSTTPAPPWSEVAALLSDLVAIDSVNPDLVPGAAGEARVADYVADWLASRGFEVHRQPTGRAGRDNVIGVLRGTGGGAALMLNGHMDTVGVDGMDRPHEPRVMDGRLHGRGALDMKGGLAAYMLAAASVASKRLPGDVILTAVVDEEHGSIGTEAVLRDWRADYALVAEPTALDLTTCHKGFVWLEVETHGVAAHGSRPDLGVDAIAKMGGVLRGVEGLAERLAGRPGHPLLGPGSVHASLISGGRELSSYPDRCTLQIERRTIPGETPDDALREVRDLLAELAARDSTFHGEARVTFSREPLPESNDAPVVRELHQAAESHLGRAPRYVGSAGWMDAALLATAGIPTVVFGPAGEGLHAVDEWVDLDSVAACAQIVAATIERVCGGRA